MGQPSTEKVVDSPRTEVVKKLQKKSRPTETLHLGVYRVILEKKTSLGERFQTNRIPELKERFLKSWKLVERLVREIVSLGPVLFILLMAVKIWEDVQDVILLLFETHVLHVVRQRSFDNYLHLNRSS